MEDEYQTLLNRALQDIPKKDIRGKRFEVPSPSIRTSGNKTLILNFTEISSRLNRDSKEVLKFMVRELATAGNVEDQRVIFQGKFSAVTIHRLLDIYTKRYVICPICKGPDTKVIKENKFKFLLCEACGAKSSIVEV
jgi:translation initiation factor 2 subunit 2